MQTLNHKNINLTYIILTEQVSFIPNNILKRSITIPVKRPTKNSYSKCTGKILPKNIEVKKICNIKILKAQTYEIMNSQDNYANQLIDIIEKYQEKQFIDIRNTIYNFFIYGIDISESLWMVIDYFIKKKKLNKDNIDSILCRLYIFFKYYNNNYRPIYHLESIIYYLINIIHEL